MPSPTSRAVARRALSATIILLLVGAALGPASAKPDNKGPSEKDLKNAQHNLAKAEARAKVLGNTIIHTRARLAQIRSDIAGLKGEITIAQNEYDNAAEALAETEDKQGSIEDDVTEIEDVMDTRVRESFMRGPGGELEFLLGASSMENLSERSAFLDALQAADYDRAQRLYSLKHDLQAVKHEQKLKAKEADRLLTYLKDQQDELQTRVKDQASTLAELDRQLHEANMLTKKWGIRVDTIAEKVNAVVVGGNGPLYACPVPEYTWWANDFGAPRIGHTHQGNDLGAQMGAEIVAPFDGRADMGSDSLGGLTVHVYGKDGYVYNAHLSRYGKTGRVEAGEVIGYVGTSGNAQGTSPHDHFEWHPNNGDAVDPYPYLEEVCSNR